MNKRRIILMLAIVCSLAAAYVSYALLMKHVTGQSGASWFDLGCSDVAGPGGANCTAVLASPYSYMPPRTGGRTGGFPVAFLGLVYYSALAVWFVGVGAPSPQRRRLHFFPLLTVGFGLAGSAYFILIMFGKLDRWCTWCLVTHGLNVMIAVCVVALWPRAVDPASDGSGGGKRSSSASARVGHPSLRVVLLTALAILLAGGAELNLLGLKSWKQAAENRQASIGRYDAQIRRIQSNGAMFVALLNMQQSVTIARRQASFTDCHCCDPIPNRSAAASMECQRASW